MKNMKSLILHYVFNDLSETSIHSKCAGSLFLLVLQQVFMIFITKCNNYNFMKNMKLLVLQYVFNDLCKF